MTDNIEVRVNDVGDILYLQFRKAEIAACREFGDLRCADYASEGRLIGVELIGLPGGVSLLGLPEAERISEALCEHGPPDLRIEGDEVFHPIQAKPAPAQGDSATTPRRTPRTSSSSRSPAPSRSSCATGS